METMHKHGSAGAEGVESADLPLIEALMLDGRAPFSRLAQVLGVSDQTVVRRYRRLRTSGLLRVVGQPRSERVGLQESWLRVACTPDATATVAEALARRPDIAWVNLVSGGAEIHCMTKAHSRQDIESLLLRKLPRTRQVTGLAAHTVLRRFSGGPGRRWGDLGALTEEQTTALRTHPVPAPESRPALVLDEAEHAMLAVLGRDGRAGHPELARAARLSESTARRRLDRLIHSGALGFGVEMAPELLGLGSHAILLASVPPGRLAAVGAAVGRHREVPFAAALTGAANLLAIVVCRDSEHLYTYLTEHIGAIPDVRQLEVVPVLRAVKRAGMLLDGLRLADLPEHPGPLTP